MHTLQIFQRAIDAACVFHTKISEEGYGCHNIETFNELVEEMAAVVRANPEFDREGIIEFFELHQD